MSDSGVRAVNLREVINFISGLPDNMAGVAKEELGVALTSADESIKNDTTLNRRTGNLMKSISFRVSGNTISTLDARIGTDSIYAPVHEFGATIRAKNKYMGVPGGPYLNIPATANKTAAGVTRKQAREVFNLGGYIAGKGVYLGGQLMFSLVKSVTIPARLNMIDKTENEIPTLLSRISKRMLGG